MPAVSLSPVFNGYQSFLATGLPNNSGFINTYVAGTNTPVATYTDATGTITNPVAIPLSTSGYPPNEIWIVTGTSVKFVVIDSNSNVIGTYDNVTGVNDISSNTSFVTKTSATGSAVIPSGTTGQRDSVPSNGYTRFNSSLNYQEYSNSGNWIPYDFLNTQRISIATATTVDLTVAAALVTRHIQLTGNAVITAFTIPIGEAFFVSCSGTPIITNNASIVTNTGLSIPVAAGDSFVVRSTGVNVVEIINYSSAASTAYSIQRGYIDGLALSTAGSSATMSIAAGQATNSTNALFINLAASISKTTSAWTVGNALGGLDTGIIANSTWYYFFLIRRPDTGVVDVTFSLNSTTPTLPANYTQYRYIGAGLTDGAGLWLKFKQFGDEFTWDTPVLDVNNVLGSITATLTTMTVPRGRKMKVTMNIVINEGGTYGGTYLSDPEDADLVPASVLTGNPQPTVSQFGTVAGSTVGAQATCYTNTSAQIRRREINTAGMSISTTGWIDLRGKNS